MWKQAVPTTANAPASSIGAEAFFQVRTNFVRDAQLSKNARWVGTMMASFANKDGWVWVRLEKLAGLCGLGLNATKAARAELVRAGYARIVQGCSGGGRFGRVKYELAARLKPRRRNGTYATGQADVEHLETRAHRRHESPPAAAPGVRSPNAR